MFNDYEESRIDEWVTRMEAVAEKNLEAAQTHERAAEEFGTQVQNMEAVMAKDRQARRDYS